MVVRGPENVGPFDLKDGPMVVGRDPACAIFLPSKRVSRKHAVVLVAGESVTMRDLGSQNGIVDADGARVKHAVLEPGGRIQVGDYVLMIEAPLAGVEDDLLLEDDASADSGDLDDILLTDDESLTPAAPIPPVHRPMPASISGSRNPIVVPAPVPNFSPPLPGPAASVAPVAAPPVAAPPVVAPSPPPPAAPPVAAPSPSRMPAGPLPFGPPTGGFGGFGAASPAPPPPLAPPPRPAPAEVTDGGPVTTPPTAPPPLAVAPAAPPSAFAVAPSVSPIVQPIAGESPPPAIPVTPAAGLGFFPQLAVLLSVVIGIVLCAPIGGIFSQLSAGSAAVTEASLQRGEQIADALGNRNAQAIAENRNMMMDTSFIADRAGVRGVMLTDNRGIVLAPNEKLRTTIAGHESYLAAMKAHDVARVEMEDGLYEIVAPVRAEITAGSGARQIVGFAFIEYDPSVVTDALLNPWLRRFAGLAVAVLAAGVVLAGGWWLVLRPIHSIREETELALHGDTARVSAPIRWQPYEALAHSINRVLTRARR